MNVYSFGSQIEANNRQFGKYNNNHSSDGPIESKSPK